MKGQWTLAAILGGVAVLLILGTLAGELPWWCFILGIGFMILAFLANR